MQKVNLCRTCDFLVSTDFCAVLNERTNGRRECKYASGTPRLLPYESDVYVARVVRWRGGSKHIPILKNRRFE